MAKKFSYRDRKGILRRITVEDVKPSLDEVLGDAKAKGFSQIEVLSRGKKRFFSLREETGAFREEVQARHGRQRRTGTAGVLYALQTPTDKLKHIRKPKRGPGMGH